MPTYTAKWPFLFVVDSRSAGVGWAIVNARIVTPSRQAQLAALRRAGFRFIGMSSDGAFPLIGESDPIDYGMLCEAWCHCFREPDRYVPAGLPRALISASDFTDYRRLTREALPSVDAGTLPFDFVYVGATEPWKQQAKNWELAWQCILRIAGELGLRALVIGVPAPPSLFPLGIEPWLSRPQFLARLARARFLFVPNLLDASPRVLTEALCLDVPVVVNRRILGGWKYVNAWTGRFFDGEDDVVSAVRACLAAPTSPRRWFQAHYGPYHAGRRLLALLRLLDPAVRERSHLGLAQGIDDPMGLAL
jgi:glycosyltransferase involved in cell wall biosynthesis